MFTRHKSLDDNQTVLSGFVNKSKKIDKKRSTGRSPSASKSHNISATSSSSTKKRNRPTSPTDTILSRNKRAYMENNNDTTNSANQGVNNAEQVLLNPELTELKRQIFAGFESLLAPIKQEIKELKDGQKVLFECDKSINNTKIEKKFIQNEERHKKLENSISVLEDQLLEKNVIFQGIHEEEYKD